MQLEDIVQRSGISDPTREPCFAKRPTVFGVASPDAVKPIFVEIGAFESINYLFFDNLLPEALNFGFIVLAGTVNNG